MTIDCQEIRICFYLIYFVQSVTWDNFCRRYKGSFLTFLISIAQVSLAAADFAFNEFHNKWRFPKSIAVVRLVASG